MSASVRSADDRGVPHDAARAHWLMLGIVAIACAVLWHTERIPADNGLGWDGRIYAGIVADPSSVISDKYYIFRALPSWLVHVGLRTLRMPIDDPHIIQGFLVLNTLLFLAATALWRPIADRLRLGTVARWLGFAAFFSNFAMLKMSFYYPVFTDPAAFALGMLVAFASLSGRQWLLALAMLASTFTWPLASLLIAPLLLWPIGRIAPPAAGQRALTPAFAAAGAAGAFLAWFVWLYVVRGQAVRASHFAIPVVPGIVWVGVAAAVAYIFLGVRRILEGATLRYAVDAVRGIRPVGLALAVAAMIPARAISVAFGDDRAMASARQFVGNVVLFSSSRPFLFAVSDLVYYGPILLLFFSKRLRAHVIDAVRSWGPGWMILAVATLGLALNSESRQSMFQFPAVVMLLALAADRTGVRTATVWWLTVLGVATSKVWFRINETPELMRESSGPRIAEYYSRYFMNHGPWMSNEAYLAQGGMMALAGLILWLHTRRSGWPAPDPDVARQS